MTDKRLHVVSGRDEGLGEPTIMDRATAAQHGVPYVHLAVFAVDIDRIAATLDQVEPFGWDVFLTEEYVLGHFDAGSEDDVALLEDACLSVLDRPPGEAVWGAQLPFAVYDAVRRSQLPQRLQSVFRQWSSPPKQLVKGLDVLWEEPRAHVRALATRCLEAPLQPPPAPPTVQALEEMAEEA